MTKTPKTRTSAETKSRERRGDDPAQYKRFREFAREHDADGEPEAFDRQFRKIVSKQPSK